MVNKVGVFTKQKILVTGGSGFIGSVTVAKLIEAGHEVVVADNGYNSVPSLVMQRIADITGTKPEFVLTDFRFLPEVQRLFLGRKFDAVIHFAALKAVGESNDSASRALDYFDNNLYALLNLLRVMDVEGVRNLVFSSSATVYGNNPYPYSETMPILAQSGNAYGYTKIMAEMILHQMTNVDKALIERGELDSSKAWHMVALRYFNPIGAYYTLGDNPQGIPNNIFPFILQTAAGIRKELTIFGHDFDKDDKVCTDGTAKRDYIDVQDLAAFHIAGLKYVSENPGFEFVNGGSGKGTSVLELVNTFQEATGQKVPWVRGARRAGDLPAFWADASKAERLFGWKTTRCISEMCVDGWEFAKGVLVPKGRG
jgi:UDP-glucose 4-epimerase